MSKLEAANKFKALSDETRLGILKKLYFSNEMSASDLLSTTNCCQPTLSHHMNILVGSGLVKARRQGKFTLYSVDRIAVEELFNFVRK